MGSKHPRRWNRAVALVGITAMLLAACTPGGEETTTSSTSPPVTPTPVGVSLMDAALGTQTVQDFVIHLDLSVVEGEERRPIHHELVDSVISEATTAFALPGGFAFTPTDSIDGHIKDENSTEIPGLSIDFGVLGLSPAGFDGARSTLISDLGPEESAEFTALLDGAATTNPFAGFLVEIVTADFAQTRSHLAPGDMMGFDIEFVGDVVAGDELSSAVIFGQTLPGDPATEEGLTPQELFAYRWANGLVVMLGDESPSVIFDETLSAVDGSVLLSRDMKKVLRNIAMARGAAQAEATVGEWVKKNFHILRIGPRGPIACLVVSPENGLCKVETEIGGLIMGAALLGSQVACRQTAEYLNRRNEQGGIEVTEPLVDAIDFFWYQLPPEYKFEDIDTGSEGNKPPSEPISCGDPTPEPETPPTGTTFGDVHVATFDGVGYDNHGTGEFVVFENSDLTVQMRLEPTASSQGGTIVTAVAIASGRQVVSLHPIGRTWVDGEEVVLERGAVNGFGSSELVRAPGRWTLVSEDGTVVEVYDNVALTTDSLVLTIRPSSSPSVGMFGSLDGDRSNEFVARDGTQLPEAIQFNTEAFQRDYIDTWRITQDESLFHYEPGETTDTFRTDEPDTVWATVDDLDAQSLSDAEVICRAMGVSRPDILPACIFDVAFTGVADFAYQSFMAQESTPDPDSGSNGAPTADGVDELSVGGFTMRLDASTTDCGLTDELIWGLTSFREGSDLLEATIEFSDPATNSTGQERFYLVVLLNGSPYAWLPTEVDSVQLAGSTLTASGLGYLNDPLDIEKSPFTSIAESDLVPFSLNFTCDS